MARPYTTILTDLDQGRQRVPAPVAGVVFGLLTLIVLLFLVAEQDQSAPLSAGPIQNQQDSQQGLRSTSVDPAGLYPLPSSPIPKGLQTQLTVSPNGTLRVAVDLNPDVTTVPVTQAETFRTLLAEAGFRADAIDVDALDELGATVCLLASVADSPDAFRSTRIELATATAPNSSLDELEIGAALNAATRAYCPTDAQRLGLNP